MKILYLIIIFIFLLYTSGAYGEGLPALIEVAESQKEMQKAVDGETESFLAVKRALETGNLQKGQSQHLIRAEYGAPVIILHDKSGLEKWVYKPGYASYFGGIKIYLFFDNKALTGIKMLNSGRY